ncbi:MAG: methyltransferase family protein, partial [Mycobacteriales bacterium]
MQIITGGWATAILGAAAQNGVFEALEPGGSDLAGVVRKTGLSTRGAQALLDGLTGLGLLVHSGERYLNTPEASLFLIRESPAYLGAMGQVMTHALSDWARLPEVARSGVPVAENTADVPDNAFWQILVPAIAAMSLPVAKMAAERLGLKQAGAVRLLDVGGGSGVWSAAWLSENRAASSVQLDWPQVNAIARDFVGKFGVADRFETIDADLHEADLGAAEYVYGFYGHIAQQETPASNIAVFMKFRRAIKPGGT